MENNVSGFGNTATGKHSLRNNNNGSQNSAFGSDALSQSTGSFNSAFGYYALYNNLSGAANTAMGQRSLTNNTTGALNVAIGQRSGGNITTGSNNIMIGSGTNAQNPTGSNQLNIGNAIYGADISQSAIAKIGINVEVPTESLEVSGTVSATAFVGDGSGLTNLSIDTASISQNDTSVSVVDSGVGEIHLDVDGSRMMTVQTGAAEVSGTFKLSGTGSETCDAAAKGTIRFNPAIGRLQYCRP